MGYLVYWRSSIFNGCGANGDASISNRTGTGEDMMRLEDETVQHRY